MTTPIRRRVAAMVTCVVLGVGTFGYMQRSAADAAEDAPRVPSCDPAEVRNVLGCLTTLAK